MNNYKRSWWVAAFIVLVQPLSAEVVDRIVAVVNDEVITLSEFNRAFEPYRKKIEETYRGADKERLLSDSRKAFLARLVDASLIAQQAKKNGVSVKDEEIMATIKDILGQRHITLEDFSKELVEDGMSLDAYKKEVGEQMIRSRLIRREIKSRLMVTDAEIGEVYRQHREDYEGREAVRIKQIFFAVPPGADEGKKGELRKEGEEIVRRLKNGEPFDLLTANYSPGQAAAGGDLGFIEKGMILPEVEATAFALNKGEVSGLIQSRAGFHIIMVVDKKGGGLKPIEEVREEIQNKLEEQKLEKKFDEWLDALRKKSHIEVKLP